MREWSEDDAAARATDVERARSAVHEALRDSAPLPDYTDTGLPLTDDAIEQRTSADRIALADDVPGIHMVPSYGGYLDVALHGDRTGTQADVEGQRIDFSPDDVARMIKESPAWQQRPIRLMSCSTGAGEYAQHLADDLGVPVYAPDDALAVEGGRTTVLHDGSWRRFEPRSSTHEVPSVERSSKQGSDHDADTLMRRPSLRDVAVTVVTATSVASAGIGLEHLVADAGRAAHVDMPGASSSISEAVDRQNEVNTGWLAEKLADDDAKRVAALSKDTDVRR